MQLNREYLERVLTSDAFDKFEYIVATSGLNHADVFAYAAWLVWDVSNPTSDAQLSQSDVGYETSVLMTKLNTRQGVAVINGWSA